jgi:hypothetical protein
MNLWSLPKTIDMYWTCSHLSQLLQYRQAVKWRWGIEQLKERQRATSRLYAQIGSLEETVSLFAVAFGPT